MLKGGGAMSDNKVIVGLTAAIHPGMPGKALI